ncbi:MAG: 4a-hydroxytetrahydrobiopterin dehydratase [Microcoleaceae cyanobacterium]
MSELLGETRIQELVQEIPNWKVEGKTLECTRTFKGFVEAVDFVNQLVQPAEQAGHHPDLEISYNKVKISLTTHDAGGLTEQDFAMAKQISALG